MMCLIQAKTAHLAVAPAHQAAFRNAEMPGRRLPASHQWFSPVTHGVHLSKRPDSPKYRQKMHETCRREDAIREIRVKTEQLTRGGTTNIVRMRVNADLS